MRKVVLSGYYGFANLGDEAVLAGVLQALRDTRLSVFPLVLSADPDATVRAHGVAAAPRGLAHVPRALRGAAALVSGGGSLLQDVTSFRSPLYYLAVLEMARRAGVPVIWFAQGIGPLRRGWVRRLVARAARQARLVVVRDERSRQELVQMGVPAHKVRVGADAVWLLPAGETPDVAASGVAGAGRPAEEVARGSPGWRLCVIWRRWPGRAAGDEEVGEALGEALRTWEQARGGQGAWVAVVAMQPGRDMPACQALARGIGRRWQGGAVQVRPAPDQPQELVRELAGFDAVVSARLHGLVLAAVAGVPMVGVDWDPKLAAFLEELQWPLPPLPAREVGQVRAWVDCLAALRQQQELCRSHLAVAVGHMRRRARESVEWLREALEEVRPAAVRSARGEGRPTPRAAGRIRLMGCPLDLVDLRGAEERLAGQLGAHGRRTGTAQVVVTLNPEMIMQARRDQRLLQAVEAADLVVPDGVGVVWAARLAGVRLGGRVPGIELAEALLARCAERGAGVFLVGGQPGVAEQAARRLCQRWPGLRVVGTHHGYFARDSGEERELVAAIRAARPGLLLVGMGVPRQELWIAERRREWGDCVGVAMGVGGSLDVWAGRVRRAPWLFRRTGTEWLYRLARQPWRARRMAVLPVFAVEALRQWAALRLRGGETAEGRAGRAGG